MTSRPPSRIYTLPLDSSFDTGHTHMIQMYLSLFNPRALATYPPKDANIDLIRNFYRLIQILKIMHTSVNFQDRQTQTLVLIQMRVITHLYNHIAFILSRKWIPI